jgi:N utilization substance protein B
MTAGKDATPKPGAEDIAEMRRAARLAAVQALYEHDMTGVPTDTVLRDFLENRWERLDREGKEIEPAITNQFRRGLFSELVKGVSDEREKLDTMLDAALAPARKVERLEAVLRAILRAGSFELANRPAVPARVIIAEYVSIADDFFAGKEPGLVNGVLDRLARTLRPDELEARKGEQSRKER